MRGWSNGHGRFEVPGIAGDNASGRSLTQIPKASHHDCPNDRSTPNRQLSSQCPRSAMQRASLRKWSRLENARTNATRNGSARCREEEGKEKKRERERRKKKEKIEATDRGEDACVRQLRQRTYRSSGINGKLPALRFPISLQLRGDELAERRHASRRRLTAKRRRFSSLERALSVSVWQLVRGKVRID